jgi:hypothetical protein
MRSGSAPPAPPIRSDRYKQGPFSHEFTADPQIPQIRLPGHHRITRNSLEEFALDPFPTDSSRQIPDLGTQRFDQKSTCPRHPLFPHTFGMILLSENPSFRAKNRAVTAGPKMTGFWTPKMRREREKKNRLACSRYARLVTFVPSESCLLLSKFAWQGTPTSAGVRQRQVPATT